MFKFYFFCWCCYYLFFFGQAQNVAPTTTTHYNVLEYLTPSFEGVTEQKIPYKVYAFRWKRCFGFCDRWFLVVADSLTVKAFAINKGKIQETLPLSEVWKETFYLAVQQYAVKLHHKHTAQGDLQLTSYYVAKRNLKKLLRNLWGLSK